MKRFLSACFHLLLIATFAMWFGGFGFYVSFVVPTGTEVLGSSFDQGMITRLVTKPLNWLGLAAAFMMLVNCGLNWHREYPRAMKIQLSMALVCLAMQLALLWLHPQVDAFVDLKLQEINGDYDQFYWLHRLYLWASTIQWLAAWVWLASWVSCFGKLVPAVVKT